MIRILIVDDHPAMRTGLSAVFGAEPGFVVLGAAESEFDLLPAVRRTQPDVVLMDYHLPPSDGLVLCRRLKRALRLPAVVMYSAYADASLAIPAILAGADGLLHKGAPAAELYDALRRVARGDRVLPPVPRELLDAAGARLDPPDVAILGMALHDTPHAEIAAALRRDPAEIAERVDRMIGRLRVEVPSPSASP